MLAKGALNNKFSTKRVNSIHSYPNNNVSMTEPPNTPRILLEDYDVSFGRLNAATKSTDNSEYADYLLAAEGKYSSRFTEKEKRKSRKSKRNKIVSPNDIPSDSRRLHGRSRTIGSHTDLRAKHELSSGLEKIMLRQYSATTRDDGELRAIDSEASRLQLPEEEGFVRSRACSNPSPLMRRRRFCPTQGERASDVKDTLKCAIGDDYTDSSGEEDFGVPIQKNKSCVGVKTDEQFR